MRSGSQLAFDVKLHNNDWIIDTRATSHMFTNKSLFHSLIPLAKPRKLLLHDGLAILVSFIGSVRLSSTITLHNTLYTLGFTHHFISVNKLAE